MPAKTAASPGFSLPLFLLAFQTSQSPDTTTKGTAYQDPLNASAQKNPF
jgi:hypothetical protein